MKLKQTIEIIHNPKTYKLNWSASELYVSNKKRIKKRDYIYDGEIVSRHEYGRLMKEEQEQGQ